MRWATKREPWVGGMIEFHAPLGTRVSSVCLPLTPRDCFVVYARDGEVVLGYGPGLSVGNWHWRLEWTLSGEAR